MALVRMPLRGPLLLGLALLLAQAAGAQPAAEVPRDGPSLSWSAFGTIGWAQSNRPWTIQRYVDRRGTAQRDTVFGAQLDAQLSPEWSATAQLRLAPSPHQDAAWNVSAAWAFVAWRPDNDWLLRVGKLRVPFFLRSELLDVGQTYDELRLPSEIYSLAPSNDFTGAHLTRTWSLGAGDLNADLYRGSARLSRRSWSSEGLAPQVAPGPQFTRIDTTISGLVLTWRTPTLLARGGLHYATTRQVDGTPFLVRPVLASLGPGLDYWQTDNALPGPGVPGADQLANVLLSVGAELKLGGGWRVAGEVVRVWQRRVELGFEGTGGYATLYRSWGAFTPYVSLMAARSGAAGAAWSAVLDATRLPAVVPGADLLNGSMRLVAEGIPVYRQQSLALGSSYALGPRSKLKLEWLHTRAQQSAMIDTPAGEPVKARRDVDVFSVNYSFVF